MNYQIGDKIYMDYDCGFASWFEGKYGYVTRVNHETNMVWHTIIGNERGDDYEWCTSLDYVDGLIIVDEHNLHRRIKKHTLI